MAISVNTNTGASLALQTLNKSNNKLDKTGFNITTGKKVNGPKVDASTFAIAQKMIGEMEGIGAVRSGLNAAEATTSVAMEAGQQVGDLLTDMKRIAIQASQDGLDVTSRQALENEFNALRDQISTVVDTAEFNGTNLLKAGGTGLSVLADENGNRFDVDAQDMSATGLNVDTLTLGTAADAEAAAAGLTTAISDAAGKLANLGSSAKRIETQIETTTSLQDSLRAGVGNLVDADMGAEAANLAAGQVKQALGVQALSIANSSPKMILGLF